MSHMLSTYFLHLFDGVVLRLATLKGLVTASVTLSGTWVFLFLTMPFKRQLDQTDRIFQCVETKMQHQVNYGQDSDCAVCPAVTENSAHYDIWK
jgi:hypothetical protein